MAREFNPYHTWLGIPAEEQPADYYRLLGITRFEEDPSVIDNAADRQMAHLRKAQTGKNAEASQKVLNEVAAARVCLLSVAKKAAYDQALGEKLLAKATKVPYADDTHTSEQARVFAAAPGRKLPLYAGMAAAVVVIVVVAIALHGRGRRGDETATAGDHREGPTALSVQSRLVLHWPTAERRFAELKVGGRSCEVTGETGADNVVVPLAAGEHQLRIERYGFKPFEQKVTIEAGKDTTVTPTWEIAQSSVPPKTEKPHELKPEEPKPTAPKPGEPKGANDPKTEEQKPTATPGEVAKTEDDAARRAEEENRREASYAAAVKAAEALATSWDFRGAAAELQKLSFDDQDSAARLAARRKEIDRLAALKKKIIDHVNAAEPRLKKSDLMLRGINGEVTQADERALTATLSRGKTETHPWRELSQNSVQRMVQLVLDRGSADDWLSTGLLALIVQDVVLAEKCFEKTRSLGGDTDAYVTPLAEAALAHVKELVAKKEFSKADAAIRSLEEKCGATSWHAAHKEIIAAAKAEVKSGLYEAESEKLYAEAAARFKQKEFFELKPLVERLKSDYAKSGPATDMARKPSLDDMEQATGNLGKLLTVRQDGRGDHKGIQAAINAAERNSTIEIQDNGPYYEAVRITTEKTGLTLRGKKGCWPVISSGGPLGKVDFVVRVDASKTSLERLVIVEAQAVRNTFAGTLHACESCNLRSVIWGGGGPIIGANNQLENCCALANIWELHAPTSIKSCMWPSHEFKVRGEQRASVENVMAGSMKIEAPSDVRSCTVLGKMELSGGDTHVRDSILGPVVSTKAGNSLEYCDTLAATTGLDATGKGCFKADPLFIDPKIFDYRLAPKSPCRKRASDGGDVGVRYTPEMIEILKLAFELRARGLVKF